MNKSLACQKTWCLLDVLRSPKAGLSGFKEPPKVGPAVLLMGQVPPHLQEMPNVLSLVFDSMGGGVNHKWVVFVFFPNVFMMCFLRFSRVF